MPELLTKIRSYSINLFLKILVELPLLFLIVSCTVRQIESDRIGAPLVYPQQAIEKLNSKVNEVFTYSPEKVCC